MERRIRLACEAALASMPATTSARAAGVPAAASSSALRQATSRQATRACRRAASSMVPGSVGVVDGGVEAGGDLGVEVVDHAVEDLVDAVVVRLAARAVRLDQSDPREHERQVALHMGVDAEQEVAGRGHLAVGGGAEGDRPGFGHRRAPARVPVVERVEVVPREHGVLVIDEAGVVEEAGILDRAPVLLGGAQIGQREDRVVIAGGRQRVEAAAHLTDHGIDAARAAGRAVVLARRAVLRGQAGQQVGPADVRRIVGVGGAGHEQAGAREQQADDAKAGHAQPLSLIPEPERSAGLIPGGGRNQTGGSCFLADWGMH